MKRTEWPMSGVGIGVMGTGGVLFLVSMVTVVPAGHVGVKDFFGMVAPEELAPGLHLVSPITRVVKIDVRTQEVKEIMNVPSKEGLTVGLETSVIFHLAPEQAAEVYKTVGMDYARILIEPQYRAIVRGVTSGYDAKSLYTSDRDKLGGEIQEALVKHIGSRGVVVETSLLRAVTLPRNLSVSIEEKLRADQDAQRMQFVLLKERQEADRKRIEAKGIADFQEIVSKGITESLLKWKGIEATERLAGSSNAKVVVIGNPENGLPLILGGDK